MVAERAGELGLQAACHLLPGGRLAFGLPSSHHCRGDERVQSATTPTMVSWEWEVQESWSSLLSPTRLVGSAGLWVKCVPTAVLARKPSRRRRAATLLIDQAGLDQKSACLCFPVPRQQGDTTVSQVGQSLGIYLFPPSPASTGTHLPKQGHTPW